MIEVSTVADLQNQVREARRGGAMVGLVPTMGAFHEGHLSLMRRARKDGGLVVVSLFVNPTQFVAGEDLVSYPRDLREDRELAAAAGVDLFFTPDEAEVYPDGFATNVEVSGLTVGLCGRSRPGHFRGVTTVVAKLFNMARPDRAYFGKKDYQQWQVIRRLARDLDFGIEIIGCPIVREADGLAYSSRNSYLSASERDASPVLQQTLKRARDSFAAGEVSLGSLVEQVRYQIEQEELATVDYVEGVDAETLQPIDRVNRPAVIAAAVRFGSTRLIDNVELIP